MSFASLEKGVSLLLHLARTHRASDKWAFADALAERGGFVEARYYFDNRVRYKNANHRSGTGYWVKMVYRAYHPDGHTTKYTDRTWVSSSEAMKSQFEWDVIHVRQLNQARSFLNSLSVPQARVAWKVYDEEGILVLERKLSEPSNRSDIKTAKVVALR
ncbi:MAG TPA: hypothetical protein VLF21_02380 [Candidatus Saccharimonadales bacterium]|nr:hypothetical protein [Candidatus Saccharimonadales bacterium]